MAPLPPPGAVPASPRPVLRPQLVRSPAAAGRELPQHAAVPAPAAASVRLRRRRRGLPGPALRGAGVTSPGRGTAA